MHSFIAAVLTVVLGICLTNAMPQSVKHLEACGDAFYIKTKVAWPAGNSGVVVFFQPQNGVNGSLSISLQNSTTTGNALDPIYEASSSSSPMVGVSGHLKLNSSAILTIPILGSIRTIRDFTEGPSLLRPSIQDAITLAEIEGGKVSLSRLWLDNETTTTLSFAPASQNGSVKVRDRRVTFEAGTYSFNASFNYPQLEQLSPQEVFNQHSQGLVSQYPDQAQSLSFLSYSNKLLAGAWRFLTYFGRDSMITMLLMEPVLSTGEGGAFEAGIAAVLERLNKTDGSAAHEETIGDYATFLNLQENITSTAPQYDYKMIDTDYFLPVLLVDYFVKNAVGRSRASEFLSKKATENPANYELTYRQLALLNAEKIINVSAPFAVSGGQTKENLIHLKEDEIIGEWRDSTYGLGGGRIPYNVNAALVPAGLRAIGALAEAGFFPEHPEWNQTAHNYAQVWEDNSLHFFEVNVPQSEARSLVENYVDSNSFPFASQSQDINSNVSFYGLALDGNNNQTLVRVMNTDDCFRLFFLNTTNDRQLSSFLSQTADHILQPYPVGLSTDVGLLVANPAYGGDPVYSTNFTNSAYHGTVVWSWQLAMMAAGLERQLGRCSVQSAPEFCLDSELHGKVLSAYNHLWDLIDANSANLSGEVWSWVYEDGKFSPTPLGALPPPPGTNPTESDIRQLWSLAFLAVKRNQSLK
ncbi:hypothetical protein DL764_005259 [Monosporascus ibericus]|uniref:Glycogen debranching enzyme C-terminal domain-containing protein n=1 Tax=Monosporascus ibericus TaxID=155417 RepID=A0A4Q4T9M7_9PEZI|nr:hypothetical protein DL764_005259 [Monosporascus ibericus]